MDVFGLPLWFIILLLTVLLIVYYVRSISASHTTFQKMGIDAPPPSRILGNFGLGMQHGVFDVQTIMYAKYKDKKVYGWYDVSAPILIVRDLDMVRDILIKQFSKFVNRRGAIELFPPFDHSLLHLRNDHWKRVRNTVTPSFTSGRIKKMMPTIQEDVKHLKDNLREKQEKNEEIDLKDVFGCFALDVIGGIAFGYEVNSLKDPQNKFVTQLKRLNKPNALVGLMLYFFPKLVRLLAKLGIYVIPKDAADYLTKFVDTAIDTRQASDSSEVNNFLDLIVQAEREKTDESSGLSRVEMQAQAFVFIVAGMETVSATAAFTLFLLAVHPECCRKVQEEIDQKIGQNVPDFDNIQTLLYLDMCVNESLRKYPPGFIIDRACTADADVQGIHIPKDMGLAIPIYAIHHDPDIWPEPDKFQPERFSPENKESRHPFAYLPFGQGPRNCIGMRLGLLEVKLALASVLQAFTPVPSAKTVYPIKLSKFALMAEDGLWVKLEARK